MHSRIHIQPDEGKPGRGAGYSRKQLQEAVHTYHDRFEKAVPLGLITGAASEFRSSELMSTLLDRIRSNDSVQNWERFSGEFFNGS